MSSSISSKLPGRRSTDSLEVERQIFIKHQTMSVNKAINSNEVPVKEKHVRSIIIGTFKEKGMTTFWELAHRTPIQGNPVVCWKFCYTLHKVLQEGHEKVMKDAMKHIQHISDLGSMWHHLQEGYGKLNDVYCALLKTKLEFHRKNPAMPGNLQVSDPEIALEKMAENDVNNLFQLSVEIFDYLDALIHLEESIFGTFDLSKTISTNNSGQCRLSPLIPVVLDSGQLYDFSVRLLFKLHACLPADTLDGHRSRFLKQFHALKMFYERSNNLSYFKHLIQVPSLPREPPDFFVASATGATYIQQAVMLDGAESLMDGSSGRDSPVAMSDFMPIEEPPITRQEESFANSSLLVDFDFPSSNGQFQAPPPEPPRPDERDQIIEQLRLEIEQLKFELQRTRKEDQRIINELKSRLIEMDMEMNEHRTFIETQCQENEDLKTEMTTLALAKAAVDSNEERLNEAEKKAKVNEDRFRKMKDVYSKLREEHVNLLREKAEITKQLNMVSRVTEEQEIAKLNAEKFVEQLQQSVNDTKLQEEKARHSMSQHRKALLNGAVDGAQEALQKILSQMADPQFATATCTSEYLLTKSEGVQDSLCQLEQRLGFYQQNEEELGNLIKAVSMFSHNLGQYLLQGKATSNMAPIHLGENLSSSCFTSCETAIDLLNTIRESTGNGQFPKKRVQLETHLQEIIRVAKELLPGEADIKEELGDLVDSEMQSTTDAILEAEKRIEEMLLKSRAADTGVKLEVNARILDSCTELMKNIKMLIDRSKHLQREIVSSGKGSATAKDFYKRHHRWTEGLISAAKLVGVGATHLVDASDKLVQGKGRFEELMVCSSEIAASTAQLVAASRVKASKESTNLKQLQVASKAVANATASVVASAKTGAQMIEEGDAMDFTNLSLTQTKRLEMESKIKVLELESKLEKERVQLDDLRKLHYQLAGASEGWDEAVVQD